MATKPGQKNDLVTHNLLGATRPVRVRIVNADHDAVFAQQKADGPDAWNASGLRLARLQRALGRVLNPRYVAEVGLVPGTADGPHENRRYAVTLRRYVGKNVDPTPVFVVRGDGDGWTQPLSGWLDALSMPTLYTGGPREEARVTITLPDKALRRCMKGKRTSMVRRVKPATTSLDVHAPSTESVSSHGN